MLFYIIFLILDIFLTAKATKDFMMKYAIQKLTKQK